MPLNKLIFKYFTFILLLTYFFSYQSTSYSQTAEKKPYSPSLNNQHPDKILWGDLHLHSNISMDAFNLGNESLTPGDAYKFARGETINSTAGGPAKLARPLDFLSVTDHAEYLGVMAGLTDPKVSNWNVSNGLEQSSLKEALLNSHVGYKWNEYIKNSEQSKILDEFIAAVNKSGEAELIPENLQRSVWEKVSSIADEYNDPGKFTALVGYEWTTIYEGNNLHRVVLFKDGKEKASQIRPFSAIDSQNPEDLWESLAQYELKTKGEVLAIPHNGNLSNGAMFSDIDLNGNPIDLNYAEMRAKWEPIYEVTQVKGDGETHPKISPNDEFSDFETWDTGNIAMSEDKEDYMLKYEYARSALNLGLKIKDKVGVNPFKFGMIGSTDSHTALATSDNDNFFGKFPGSEPTIGRFTNKMADSLWPNITISSSGYTAVWAKENTREEIFNALKRKEVYATTGPRIALRLFGGWNLNSDDLYASNFAIRSYSKGVPMGGTLIKSKMKNDAPTFLIRAMRDPIGANLDRVQIIKGWLDENNLMREKIYNVSLSGNRKANKDGIIEPVGNTVNLDKATYSNSIGSTELTAVWKDPNFNKNIDAFYYVRVLEIPTPRWSTYDAVRFGVDRPENVPPTLQERAYSSPIWYDSMK